MLGELGDVARAGVCTFAVNETRSLHLLHVANKEWRLLHEALPRVDDDFPRAEHLPGNVRRTGRGTTAALGARVTIEQLLPREVLDIGRSELFHARRVKIEEWDCSLR